MKHLETADLPKVEGAGPSGGPAVSGEPVPGLVLVYSAGQPTLAAISLGGAPLVLGREGEGVFPLHDATMSRRHAEVRRESGVWRVRDLGSRNGTFVDGGPADGAIAHEDPTVLRLGDTLFLFTEDLRRFASASIERREGGMVVGPTLREAWARIEGARAAEALHLSGESGSGKELFANGFHKLGPSPSGPFVAVNCATIPETLAERLLFGAKKGAFSGADKDVEGFLVAASGGTLFLDEVAELDLNVQAKLLRVLETREVLPLGSTKAVKIDVRVVSATHRGLRAQVAKGKFREDLYFRMGRPEVAIPPLRDRLEEVPWLVHLELGKLGARAHVSLLETCLLRPWPGNVRELLSEVRTSGREALGLGRTVLDANGLSSTAGMAFGQVAHPSAAAIARLETTPPSQPTVPQQQRVQGRTPTAEELTQALQQHEGNVARTARALGVHRTQLRRWLERYSIDPARFAPPGATRDGSE
jgi:transcriptional regulator of acetoin/glycerol metabolism